MGAGASAGLKEASHIGKGRAWSAGLETPRRGLARLDRRTRASDASQDVLGGVLCRGISFLGCLGASWGSVLRR